MIDTLVAMEPRFRAAETARHLRLRPGGFVLMTLHPPALVDRPLLSTVLERPGRAGTGASRGLPGPSTHAGAHPAPHGPSRIVLTERVGYLDFLLAAGGRRGGPHRLGGVQEETSILGMRCFTLRDSTERPVTGRLGTDNMLGLDPERISDILPALDDPPPVAAPLPRWDGHAAHRLADVEKALAA